jgi:Domain of unknown function (DU1801)
MLRPIDHYYLQQKEPILSCLQFLRQHILQIDKRITEEWKYGMPFFCLHRKMICYLWVHKKLQQPYIGFVEGTRLKHADLLQEKRAKMKILLLDATKDIPLEKVNAVLQEMLTLY